MSKKLKITQIKSVIGSIEAHKRTICALGLKKIRKTVLHNDTPAVRGMVDSVKHLVKVELVDGE